MARRSANWIQSALVFGSVLWLASSCARQAPDYKAPPLQGSPFHVQVSDVHLPKNDPEVPKLADHAAAEIPIQYQKILAPLGGPAPGCSEPAKYAAYQKALGVSGRLAECESMARSCLNRKESHEHPDEMLKILVQGAHCADTLNHFEEAYRDYDLATQPGYQQVSGFPAAVYRFARFAELTQYSEQAPSILKRDSSWNSDTRRLYFASIQFLETGATKLATSDEVKSFVKARLQEKPSPLRDVLLLAWMNYLSATEYRFHDTAVLLNRNIDRFTDPSQWVKLAYGAVYHSIGPTFHLASKIYDAYIPYTTPDSWLPLEDNTYTYTELYKSKCALELLQGKEATIYQQIKSDYRTGKITLKDALGQALALSRSNPNAADLLTLIGGLEEELGHDDLATQYFWRAHLSCPQYNRSHWGLTSVSRRQRQKAFSDYAKFDGQIQPIVNKLKIPSTISQYVTDWNSLSPTSRVRLEYAIRFWMPYLNWLNQKNHLYVKRGYELLSESPGLANVRDQRIEMPTHEWDHRLWDDVRGLGGGTVAVDIDEMSGAPFGSYNLAGHEMAHQFEYSLPPRIQACIPRLYEGAKKRGGFAEAYSASNEMEYFAQGVVYYLIPSDAPQRWGLNVSWLIKNDADLYHFLDGLESAGDVNSIQCPI